MRKLSKSEEQRMDHFAELFELMIGIVLLLICALLFLKHLPAIAPAVQWVEVWLMEYGR